MAYGFFSDVPFCGNRNQGNARQYFWNCSPTLQRRKQSRHIFLHKKLPLCHPNKFFIRQPPSASLNFSKNREFNQASTKTVACLLHVWSLPTVIGVSQVQYVVVSMPKNRRVALTITCHRQITLLAASIKLSLKPIHWNQTISFIAPEFSLDRHMHCEVYIGTIHNFSKLILPFPAFSVSV